MDVDRNSDSTDITMVDSLEGSSPRHVTLLHSSMDLTQAAELDIMLRRVGKLPARDVSAYTALDMQLTCHWSRSLAFSLLGRNLLDKHHTEFLGDVDENVDLRRAVFLYARLVF